MSEPKVRTLLLTDLVDSTKLVEKLGDARISEIGARHDRAARDLLHRFGGTEIDKTDGFLLLFERVNDAVAYALAYHEALAELSHELGVELRARAGIHLGEVILRETEQRDVTRGAKPLEVEGLAKPMAARTMSLALGRQTLMTKAAFDLARQTGEIDDVYEGRLQWLAHGPYRFKGVDEPVEIFEVGIAGVSPLTPPKDTAKARRAVTTTGEVTLGWRPGPRLEIPRRPGWLLERRLGEGGFGEVWVARESATGERRAFKFCYDPHHLRTLQREVTLFRLLRETLGDRPQIVRMYDWSFDEAPYYLEEELVAGGDLIEWTDAQGGAGGLPLETRLEIAAQVADALAAAHSVGVLHKDVKPTNVLISPNAESGPTAKLADFGIGGVLDERALLAKGITVMGLTAFEASDGSSLAGSRLYMAPEVIEGRGATVQADIYALGVILYQLLCGDFRRALGAGWRRDIADELLAEDLASFVDRDPARRPASAREVAERLRALEERRAERAAIERERREAEETRRALERGRRRRRILAAVAAVSVVVLAVVSVLALQAMRARDAAKRSQATAETRREQAESLLGFMLGDLAQKLEPLGKLDILNDIGDAALAYFASVHPAELTDDEIFGRSEAMIQIGEIRLREGDLDASLEARQEVLRLAQELVERDPRNIEWKTRLGASHFWIGRVYWEKGDVDAALEQFQSQLEISGGLAQAHPENPDLQLEYAHSRTNVGFVQQVRGDLPGALASFRSVVQTLEEILVLRPDDPAIQLEYADQSALVASLLWQLGEPGSAMEHYQASVAMAENLVEREPDNAHWQHRLATFHNLMGRALAAVDERARAGAHFTAALEIARLLVAIEPNQTGWQQELAIARRFVALDWLEQGKIERATAELRLAAATLDELIAKESTPARRRERAMTQLALGQALRASGETERARQAGRAAASVLESELAENPKDRDNTRRLAEGLLFLGSLEPSDEAARMVWQRALNLVEPVARASRDLSFLVLWSDLLERLGRREDLVEARRILEPLRQEVVREQSSRAIGPGA